MKVTMFTFTYLDSSLFYEENKARLFYLSENGNADIGFIQKEYWAYESDLSSLIKL